MNTNMNLPKEYTPYGTLNLCSNIATNYQVPIGAKNFAPLLIGKGQIPLIWLAISNPENSEEWRYLVSMNKSLHPNMSVETNEPEQTVLVKSGNDLVLSVTAQDQDHVIVNSLDLRSIGLNIVGNPGTLTVGGSTLSSNSFSGVGTIIGLS
ncbi:MAG: hypothetical protein GY928_32715 [Colwellia sp.]|nr:hypothetical protein [Colwellia sp.]